MIAIICGASVIVIIVVVTITVACCCHNKHARKLQQEHEFAKVQKIATDTKSKRIYNVTYFKI